MCTCSLIIFTSTSGAAMEGVSQREPKEIKTLTETGEPGETGASVFLLAGEG